MSALWCFLVGLLLGVAAAWGWFMRADRGCERRMFCGRSEDEMERVRQKCRAIRESEFPADRYEDGVLATLNWLSYPNHQPPVD